MDPAAFPRRCEAYTRPRVHRHRADVLTNPAEAESDEQTEGLCLSVAGIGLGACVAIMPAVTSARQDAGAVRIDPDDIGGVVSSARGPEAGVWVIAETSDLPTGFRKIVVTDEGGR